MDSHILAMVEPLLDIFEMSSALLDAEAQIVAVNRAWRAFGGGLMPSSQIGANYLAVCESVSGADAADAMSTATHIRTLRAAGAGSFAHPYTCRMPDGSSWYAVKGSVLHLSGALYILLRHENITTQVEAELSLYQSRANYQLVWEATNDAMALSDPHGIVLDANPAYYRLYGGSPANTVGLSFARIFPPEQRMIAEQQYREAFTGQPHGTTFESEVLGADGVLRVVESRIDFITDQGRRSAMLSVIRDITERKRMAATTQEHQHLERIGLLAGGIAHDFNNILTAVYGHAELAHELLTPDHPAVAELAHAFAGLRQVHELTNQLLAYAGKGLQMIETVALNYLLHEAAGILQATRPDSSAVHYQLAPDLPPVQGDPTQLRQLFVHVLLNASEATAGTPAQISVSSSTVTLGREDLRVMQQGSDRPPGVYVLTAIVDQGEGMDAATLARAFDPFFSTRALGRGLGLAVVQGVVRRHGGALKIISALAAGTTVQIYLPVATGGATTVANQAQAAAAPVSYCLVIDGEAAVRTIAVRMIERLGLHALAVESSAAGLALLREGSFHVSAVLIDMIMPQMSGDKVIAIIQRMWPGLRTVLMSGYNTSAIRKDGVAPRPDAYLEKPFTFASLRAALGLPPEP